MSVTCRIVTTLKSVDGPCDVCEDVIPKGMMYCTVIIRMGTSKKSGKQKWRSDKVHLNICLSKWVILDYMRFDARKKSKGGRPKGSGMYLSDDGKAERRHLIRTRARLLRLILATPDWEDSGMDRIRKLVARVEAIQPQIRKLGGPINDNLNRRALEVKKVLDAKIKQSARYIA